MKLIYLQKQFDPFIIEYFKTQRKVMSFVGIWPFSESKSEMYLKISIALLLDVFTFVNIWGEINAIWQTDDLTVQIEIISTSLTQVITMFKSWVVLFGQRQLKQIFFMINDLYSNTPIEHSQNIKDLIEDTSKHMNKMYIYIFISGWGACLLYIAPTFVHFTLTGEWQYMHDSYFPGVKCSSTLFFLILFIQTMVSARAALLFFYDSLFPALILMICIKFDVLLETMKLSLTKDQASDRNHIFKKGIEYHRKITK